MDLFLVDSKWGSFMFILFYFSVNLYSFVLFSNQCVGFSVGFLCCGLNDFLLLLFFIGLLLLFFFCCIEGIAFCLLTFFYFDLLELKWII